MQHWLFAACSFGAIAIGCGRADAQAISTPAPTDAAQPQVAAPNPADAAAPSSPGGDIVVTAQKRSESVQKVPISIQAFSERDLRALGVESSTDIGKFTPNVDIGLPAGAGNQPIVVIRGVGLNDTNTNNAGPNGIYVDEVYLSAPASQTFQSFDLERVEVLKGPQGTLYGRNSSGGAINFITNKPTDTTTIDARATYGSFNTYTAELAVGGPLSSDLDGRIAVTKSGSSGYFHNDLTGTRENGSDTGAFRAQLLYKPDSDLHLLFNVHGGYVRNRPTEYRHIGTLDPATLGDPVPTPCAPAVALANSCVDAFGTGTPADFYHGSFNRREKLRVNSIGGYVRADYSVGAIDLTSLSSFEHNDKFHPEDSDATALRLVEINFGVKSDASTQEFRAAHTQDNYNWVVGLYYLHENLRQDQSVDLLLDGDLVTGVPGSFDGLAERGFGNSRQITNAYAAFGQGEYAVTSKLRLIAGGRFTHETKSFDYLGRFQTQEGGTDQFSPLALIANASPSLSNSKFSFRVGANYTPVQDVLAYASIATGFKSGGFNGGFLSTNPVEVARQLQPIRPETVTAYEIGVKSSFLDRRVKFNAALFYNDYRDLQVAEFVAPVTPGGNIVSVLDNARRGHTEGLDLSIVARPVRALTLTGQLGLLDAKVDDFLSSASSAVINYSHNQLALAPHRSALLIADYKVPFGTDALDLQVTGSHKSHQYFDISNSPLAAQDAYWLGDARVSYSLRHGSLELAAFVRNFTDKKYFVYAVDLTNPLGFSQGVTGVPRTIGVEANFHY